MHGLIDLIKESLQIRMRAVTNVEAVHRNTAQFEQSQAQTVPSTLRIALDDSVPFENGCQAMHGTLVEFHFLRQLRQAGVLASIRQRIDNGKRPVEHLDLVR